MVKTLEEFLKTCPADLEEVDRLCAEVNQLLDRSALPQTDRFAIELLLREALNNAVIHGSQQNPGMQISCRIVLTAQRLTIEVTDQGPGFDWHSEVKKTNEPLQDFGRGLSIYSLYATSFKFNRRGNSVTLRRVFHQGEQHV